MKKLGDGGLMKKLLAVLLTLSQLAYADAPPTQSDAYGGNSTDLSCYFNDGQVTSGSVIYYVAGMTSNSWTMSSGPTSACMTFTELPNSPITSTNGRLRVYRGTTTGGCQSITATASGAAPYGVFCAEYAGLVDTAIECDAAATGSGATYTSGNCVTTSNNVTIMSAGFTPTSSITFTAGSNYTVRESGAGTNHSEYYQDRNAVGAGTYTASATPSSSSEYAVHIVAFASDTQDPVGAKLIQTGAGTGSITTQAGTGSITH